MALTQTSNDLATRARRVYDERLRDKLEAEHFGEVIAVEPDSGGFVLGKDFMEVFTAKTEKFGAKQVYVFRVGGGGAVRIGGAYLNARVSRRNQPSVPHD